MQQITKEFLKKHSACHEGFNFWIENCEGLSNDKQIRKLAKEHNDWANWLLVRIMTRKQKIKYAIFAAEQVIGIYEKKYPDNKAPRKAIAAAKKVLKYDSKNNRAYAAAAAADAADALYAAADAYAADAYAAAAADAAADAADAAAAAADADAARVKMQRKIINYGIRLINNQ